MARHRSRRSSKRSVGKGNHHPLVVAGAAIAVVGLIAYAWEKKAAAATNTATVQGATLPSGGGTNLPAATIPASVDKNQSGSDTAVTGSTDTTGG